MKTPSCDRRTFLTTTAGAVGAMLAGSFLGAAGLPGLQAQGAPAGRRIGIVDDNLENYHANVFLQALRGPLAGRGFRFTGCTGLKTAESRAWAEKNQVPWFDTVAAMDRSVDFYMVLAPSTPGTHLGLCRSVFPMRKPVYVDKTFAPDYRTATSIFALADRHGAQVQTTSALRYTNVHERARALRPLTVEHAVTWGGGGSFDEYVIHPLELLISLMGPEVTAVMRRGTEAHSQLLVEFTRGRTGVVNVVPKSNTPFAANISTAKATEFIQVDVGRIFTDNLAAILDFYEAGTPNVDRRESLVIMKLLDLARDARARKRFVRVET